MITNMVAKNNFKEDENIVHNENELRSPPRILQDHPIENVIGKIDSHFRTRNQLNQMGHVAFLSNIEPRSGSSKIKLMNKEI